MGRHLKERLAEPPSSARFVLLPWAGPAPLALRTVAGLDEVRGSGSGRLAGHLAVKLVAVGRSTGIPGLPQSDDWTTWDARQMRAAVEYLERLRVR